MHETTTDIVAILRDLRQQAVVAANRLRAADATVAPLVEGVLRAGEALVQKIDHVLGAGARLAENLPHVLIVDDQPSTRVMLHSLLRAHGFSTTEVGSIAEAQRAIAGQVQFAAIVTDIHLPDGNGLQLARNAVSGTGMPATPVIAISGDDDGEILAEIERNRIAWLPKSRLASEIVDRLAGLVTPCTTGGEQAMGNMDPSTVAGLGSIGSCEQQIDVIRQALADAAGCLASMAKARSQGHPRAWIESAHALHGIVIMLGATRFTPILKPVLRASTDANILEMVRDGALESALAGELANARQFYERRYVVHFDA